jgi:putative ABC transport system permease protein
MSFMFTKNIALAINAMRTSRGRSFLTMLGVIIAVAAVTTVVSIGHGVRQAVTKQADQYSQNVITVRPAQIGAASGGLGAIAGGGTAASLSSRDVSAITKVRQVDTVVPLSIVGSSAQGDGRFNGVVFAVSSDLPQVLRQELAYGAFFTSRESSNSVAVLGANAAAKLFDQRVPLGRSFTIRGQQFIVAGVLTKFASTPFASGVNFNDAIFVPTSASKTLTPGGAPIYEVLAIVESKHDVPAADDGITRAVAKTGGTSSDVNILSYN